MAIQLDSFNPFVCSICRKPMRGAIIEPESEIGRKLLQSIGSGAMHDKLYQWFNIRVRKLIPTSNWPLFSLLPIRALDLFFLRTFPLHLVEHRPRSCQTSKEQILHRIISPNFSHEFLNPIFEVMLPCFVHYA